MARNAAKPAIKIVDKGIGRSQGTREYQEDRFKFHEQGSLAFFAIYDGHGGDKVSTFVQEHLHDILLDRLDHYGHGGFDKAITKSLEEIDRRLRKEGIGYEEGSTVSLALVDLHAGTMVTADLGDSHTFLGVQDKEGKVEISQLSHRHLPSDESERQRIEDAGGEVRYVEGAHRIGSVDMSRAVGDLNCKIPRRGSSHPLAGIFGSILTKVGNSKMTADWISNVPHTNHRSLTGVHRSVLLLASDGLGGEKDCVSCVNWAARQLEAGVKATLIATELAEKSSMRTGDNSTVVVVAFEEQHVGGLKH